MQDKSVNCFWCIFFGETSNASEGLYHSDQMDLCEKHFNRLKTQTKCYFQRIDNPNSETCCHDNIMCDGPLCNDMSDWQNEIFDWILLDMKNGKTSDDGFLEEYIEENKGVNDFLLRKSCSIMCIDASYII